MNPVRRRILVLSDGRPANETQGLGLAEALAARVPAPIEARIEARTVRLRAGLDRLPSRLLTVPLALAEGLDGPAPDLAIGAGRRGNLAAFLWARRGVEAVAVLHPHLPQSAFAAVVLPAHDARRGPNVLTALGAMNRLTPEAIAAAPCPAPDLPAPRLAVLIGGPSRSARFEADALIADLARFRGWSLIATPSRRTPGGLAERLRAAFPGLWLWDGTGANPYPGMLAGADAVMVTADSVNMASEAATTGLPVFVSGRPAPGKHARFHEALATRGIARPAETGPARWSYTPLHEAGRIADRLVSLLRFSGAAARRI